MHTGATMLTKNPPQCWVLLVVSVCTLLCVLFLAVAARSLKLVKLLSQQLQHFFCSVIKTKLDLFAQLFQNCWDHASASCLCILLSVSSIISSSTMLNYPFSSRFPIHTLVFPLIFLVVTAKCFRTSARLVLKTKWQPNFVSLRSFIGRFHPRIRCMSILCWELLHPFAQHYQHHLTSVEPTTLDNVGSCCVHLQGALGHKRKLRANFVTLVRLHPSYVPPNNSMDRQPFLISKCFPSAYINIHQLKNCV